MESSKTLTAKTGNWIEENSLTKYELTLNQNANIYRKLVGNYVNLVNHSTLPNENKESAKLESHLPEFKFPTLSNHYDIVQKKFSKKVQRWQGVVTKFDNSTFEARLKDLTNGGTDEIAILEINDISPEDKELLSVGAVFYWSAGYHMDNGQIYKRSDIRFQRLITLDSEEFESALNNVDILLAKFKPRDFDNDASLNK
jgi:hypothetical protein